MTKNITAVTLVTLLCLAWTATAQAPNNPLDMRLIADGSYIKITPLLTSFNLSPVSSCELLTAKQSFLKDNLYLADMTLTCHYAGHDFTAHARCQVPIDPKKAHTPKIVPVTATTVMLDAEHAIGFSCGDTRQPHITYAAVSTTPSTDPYQ